MFFHHFKIVVRWNLLLLIFCGNFDEVALYSSLEFKTLRINNFLTFLSFAFSLAFVGAALFVIGQTVYIVYKYQKIKRSPADIEIKKEEMRRFAEKWEYYQVLFRGYKDDSMIKQAYMFFFVVRIAVYNLIVAYLIDHPLA